MATTNVRGLQSIALFEVLSRARRVLVDEGVAGVMRRVVSAFSGRTIYARWVALYDSFTKQELATLLQEVINLPRNPTISIVVPVYNTSAECLEAMIESVRSQIYPHWQLCIADDASGLSHVREILQRHARQDSRILLTHCSVNGHISVASNKALSVATGDYIALLDHDDLIAKHALAIVVKYINRFPQARLFYSDQDKISHEGKRHSPYFKPDWDPELIIQQNFFSHLGVFEASLIRQVGGFRVGMEGAQDHDLVLRCVRMAGDNAVTHIPHVLYHWREVPGSTAMGLDQKPYAAAAGVKAVSEHLALSGIQAELSPPRTDFPFIDVEYTLPASMPSVLVVIDASDRRQFEPCLEWLLARTDYSNFRVLIVGGGRPTLQAHAERVVFLETNDQARTMAATNAAIARSDEEYVCLVDAQTFVTDPLWLVKLVRLAAMPWVGLAGARVGTTDGRIVMAGLVRTGLLSAVMARPGHKINEQGYVGLNLLTRQVTMLPAVGVVTKRSLFIGMGGLPEGSLNWIERGMVLSERMNNVGLRNLLVASSVLMRDFDAQSGPTSYGMSGGVGGSTDRFYNPNLALSETGASFRLAFPPRIGIFD